MPQRIATALLTVFVLLLVDLPAQKNGTASSPRSSSTSGASSSKSASSKSKGNSAKSSVPKKSTVAARASSGKIHRSAAAKKEFMKQTGYPNGRKVYVVDHIVPLECGGADAPSNMQWQTAAEGKIKDRREGNCRK